MKTFQEFILEALLIENDQEEFVKIGAEIRMLRSRDRPGDAKRIKELTQRAAEFQMKSQGLVGDSLKKSRSPQNPNSITGGGYPQVGTSQHSRIDPDTLKSQPNIEHPDDDKEARSNRVVAGRHSDTRKGTGMKATLKNRGTSRTGDTLGRTGRP
jgi:hypothetical protein